MDGPFYNDLRSPFIVADIAAVTLAATDSALYPLSNFAPFGGSGYWWAGKKIKIRLFGRMTTVLTPGNGVMSVRYGTGANANGVVLASTAAHALAASQTNLTWEAEIYVRCVSIGSAGTLFCTGHLIYNEALVAPRVMLPASAPVVSAAVDLTVATNIISVQYNRSGTTAETMQVHDIEVIALN